MKLTHFTDEITLDKEKINNKQSILYLDNFLGEFTNLVIQEGMAVKDACFFYKRNKKRESVIGMQIVDGDIEDLSNYLLFECRSELDGDKVRCSVGYTADEKNDEVLATLSPALSYAATRFFVKVEELCKNDQQELEIDSMVQVNYGKNVAVKQ